MVYSGARIPSLLKSLEFFNLKAIPLFYSILLASSCSTVLSLLSLKIPISSTLSDFTVSRTSSISILSPPFPSFLNCHWATSTNKCSTFTRKLLRPVPVQTVRDRVNGNGLLMLEARRKEATCGGCV